MAKKTMIVEMDIKDVIPYEFNPRINDDAVEYVAESINSFGFRVPILVDKESVIITGHTRLLAAKRLGLSTVPVIVANDMTPNQVQAFRLADNKVSEYSEWDYDKLLGEIELIDSEYDWLDFSNEFPNVSEELEEFTEKIEKEQPLLKFLNYEIPLTDKERLFLTNAVNSYVEDNGDLLGFIANLVSLDD